jgi:hypothetical protein
MIEIKVMRETRLEKKMPDMILNGQRESIVMIERWFENGLVTVVGKSLEIVSVKGEIVIVRGKDTGKIGGTDMLIIIGTETVNQSMRRSGSGGDRLELTANHDYHRTRNTILGQKMLIMERGGV